MTVLRRAYVEVEPSLDNFDDSLKTKLARQDPGNKAGKQIGGQLNRALKRFDLTPIDVKADPKSALAGIAVAEAKLRELSGSAATVEVKVQTDRALGQLTRFRKQLGGEAIKVTADPSPAEATFAKLARQLNDVGLDGIDIKANPADALFAIRATQERLEELRDDAQSVELRLKAEHMLATLGQLRKRLGDAGDDAAPKFAVSFSQRLGPLLAKLPISGPLLVAVGGAGAAAAPLLGAALVGGVLGGVGIGGVVGGLTLAAKDERVKAAAKDLADGLEKRLFKAGGAFVKPAIEGLHQVQVAVDDIDLEAIFAQSAKFVQPLTAGVASAVTDIGAALKKLVENAGPSIGAISDGIALIGKKGAEGLSLLADNGEEGAAALRTLFEVVGSAVTVTFQLVNALTELYGIGQKIGADFALQTMLKLTGAEMDETGFSARRVAGDTSAMGDEMIQAAVSAEDLKKKQEALKAVQDAVKVSQDALSSTLDSLGGKTTFAARSSDALKTAMDNLYGAAIRQTDANEAYQASFDTLSNTVEDNAGSFKHNRDNLDLHTKAGRSNRDALQDLLIKSGELYLADIAAGKSVEYATGKHNDRTTAVRKEAEKVHLNKGETDKLIKTYNNIPPDKTTKLVLDGVRAVVQALTNLYIYQRALAEGRSIASIEQKMRTGSDSGPAKRGGGFASGGEVGGFSPHKRADNIPAWLTAEEWVHPVDSVHYYGPKVMAAIQKRQIPREVLAGFATGQLGRMGDLPLFASGGQVAPVDTSRLWKFAATMARTRIPSKAEVASKVPIGSGPGGAFARAQNGKPYIWASAGPRGYDCSGIVSAVYNVLHGRNPYSHTFSTASLPGRWFTKPGVGGPLTAAWSHPGQSPASSTTGHMMGMVGGLTFESTGSRGVHLGASTRRLSDFAHVAHYNRGGPVVPHIAMDDGGFRVLRPGLNVIPNGTGRPEPIAGPAAMAAMSGGIHVHLHNAVIATERQAVDLVVKAVKTAKKERRL